MEQFHQSYVSYHSILNISPRFCEQKFQSILHYSSSRSNPSITRKQRRPPSPTFVFIDDGCRTAYSHYQQYYAQTPYYQQYTPQTAQQQTQVAAPVPAPVKPVVPASTIDTTDVSKLNDALGSAGVDLRVSGVNHT